MNRSNNFRASTEFTGWSTSSTTPISIEKLLLQSKASEETFIKTSTPEPTTISTTIATSTTSTTVHSPTTTPGQCSENDSVCELVGTVRLVGSGSEKWVPELLDHNTVEWRLLANEVESQVKINFFIITQIRNFNLLRFYSLIRYTVNHPR